MGSENSSLQLVKGIAGAIVGGAIGYGVFVMLSRFGIYAIILPGALIGIAASYGSRMYSLPLGIICAVAALPVSLLAHGHLFRFIQDDSLQYLFLNFYKLPTMELVMMLFGVFAAFYFGKGQDYFGRK
jgi:hypothetical protein